MKDSEREHVEAAMDQAREALETLESDNGANVTEKLLAIRRELEAAIYE